MSLELIAALLVLAVAQARPDSQPPPRDPISTEARTGMALIRGRVTDRQTGRPLPRVMVTLGLHPIDEERALARAARGGQPPIMPRITVTAADGGYEFTEIAAGRYLVMFDPDASRATHLRQTLGALEPTDETRLRDLPPLIVKDGERRVNANIALRRALAMEGRVLDESGEPMANVDVSLHPADQPPEVTGGRIRTTDDRGAFRLFGLKPGRYRICAKPAGSSQPTAEPRERYVRTCYPPADAGANAQPIILKDAEVRDIELRIERRRTYTVSGLALDSTGAPLERGTIRLITLEKSSHYSSFKELRAGGRFVIEGLTPGDYAIQAEIGSPLSSSDRREREVGYVPVRVEAADVEGVLVTTSKLARVAGRVTFEDDVPTRRSTMYVVALPDETTRGATTESPLAQVSEDLTFELTRLFRAQVIAVWDAPSGWTVKHVKYRGEDITDLPTEFKSSTEGRDLEITLTSKGAFVTGRVLDENGLAVNDGEVMLISADPARRGGTLRIARSGTSNKEGTFALGPVRAGEYIVVAFGPNSIVHQEMSASKEIARVAKAGQRVVLGESEKREINLRVVKLR